MKPMLSKIIRHKYFLILIALLGVHIANMFIDVMEIDASQYAAISSNMFKSKSYLEVYYHGQDYLDKPPLLFWLSSLSFTLFGISNFTYKLFSVLSLFLGVYATYRFARLWYSKYIAIVSALILLSSQAYYLMTNDVRTDGLLTSFIIISVWLLTEFIQKEKIKYLMFGAIATGLALLAKGPIGFIAVAIAIGSDLLIKKQWKTIFRIEWVLYIFIIAVILLPMCYGLYTQFDLHPEKTVYGLNGPSGLHFFFWTQSFGRITGEIYWNNNAPLYYFFETIIWDFQPWVVLLFLAFFHLGWDLIKNRFKSSYLPEYTSVCTFVLVFVLLSLSHYKLPHYIFIIFPFASIIVANYLNIVYDKTKAWLAKMQMVFIHLFFIMLGVNFIFFFPPSNILLPLCCLVLLWIIWISYKRLSSIEKIVIPTLLMSFTFNMVLSLNFYPNLLAYQSTSEAGKWVKENKIENGKMFFYNSSGYALDFYSQLTIGPVDLSKINELDTGSFIYTDEAGKDELLKRSDRLSVVKEFPSFFVTSLSLEFLNKNTRDSKLKHAYILKYY